MIDLIIPYYNNPQGLIESIKSINKDIFYITIVDDHSTEQIPIGLDYDQIFRININRGPGCARQLGINKTNNEYIMFLDTGDIFLSKEIQKEIVWTIISNPNADIISFPYYHKDKLTKETDNRMHGKIYKRKFIEKYNITFCAESSYLDEDIGFNHACKLLTKNILFINTPIIKQIYNKDSLTEKNNAEAIYKDQTRALSLVSIHAINICRQNNVSAEEEIYMIAVALYYWFIRTAVERPEFLQDAWSGAKIFYDYFKDEIKLNQLISGNAYMKKCLEYRKFLKFPINILRFADLIQTSSTLSSIYLTF